MIRLLASAVGVFGATLLSLPPATAADELIRLAPSTPWHVNYADDSCRLARRFGEGDDSVLLILDRYEPGDSFRLSIAGQPLRGGRAPRYVTLRFGPIEGEQRLTFSSGQAGDLPAIFVDEALQIAPLTNEQQAIWDRVARGGTPEYLDIDPLDPARAEAVEYVEFDAAGISPTRLESGSLGPPFAAFDQCVDELLTHWGIDPVAQRSLTREAVPTENPGRWLGSSDYPREALRRGDQAVVNFRVIVDREGRVSECHIQQSTRPESFDRAVCQGISRRARFDPALDADGSPVESYYVNTVRFAIPY